MASGVARVGVGGLFCFLGLVGLSRVLEFAIPKLTIFVVSAHDVLVLIVGGWSCVGDVLVPVISTGSGSDRLPV
jgi:hypothetical protein